MEVISKKFPTVLETDVIFPVLIWQNRPEIIHIAIYNHKHRKRLTMHQAEQLNTQILYEDNDFVIEKGNQFTIGRVYRGIGIFRKNELLTLRTNRHIFHRL